MGKARLLVVEDDIDIGNMLKIYFSGMDFDVDVAVRGSDALEKTKQVLPHLIVLDIMLPDIDGYEVCRNLRTNMRTSHIPVIFLRKKMSVATNCRVLSWARMITSPSRSILRNSNYAYKAPSSVLNGRV